MRAWVRWAVVLMIFGASAARVAWAASLDDKAASTTPATTAAGAVTGGDASSKDSTAAGNADAGTTPQPAPAATSATPDPASTKSTSADIHAEWAPMPAWSGNPGMFTVETGETLPRGGFAFTAGAEQILARPGKYHGN